MSVTVINEWRFLDDADLAEAMSAIREYMAYLATYHSMEALDEQRGSPGTERFVERLYPLIDSESVAQPVGQVVANTGHGPGEV